MNQVKHLISTVKAFYHSDLWNIIQLAFHLLIWKASLEYRVKLKTCLSCNISSLCGVMEDKRYLKSGWNSGDQLYFHDIKYLNIQWEKSRKDLGRIYQASKNYSQKHC